MPIEDHRESGAWRLRLPLIVGVLAGAGAMTQLGLPTDAQALVRAVRDQVRFETTAERHSDDAGSSVWRQIEENRFEGQRLQAAAAKGVDARSREEFRDRIASGTRTFESNVPEISKEVIASHIARTWRVDAADVRRYVSLVWASAAAHKLDPVLVLAIIATESSFNPRARSSAGAEGLMQVHTRVHKDKLKAHGGPRAIFDPAVNIDVGSRILKRYLDRYGRTQRALKAYVGAADLPHDSGYAKKVLSRSAEFRAVIQSGVVAARERDAVQRDGAASLMSGVRQPRS